LSSSFDVGSEFVFKIEDTDGNFECSRSCSKSIYNIDDQRCLDDCSLVDNAFLDEGFLGECGVTTGTLYGVCVENSCSNSEYLFFLQLQDKTCVEACPDLDSGMTLPLTSSLTDDNGMTQCVAVCEAGTRFITEFSSPYPSET